MRRRAIAVRDGAVAPKFPSYCPDLDDLRKDWKMRAMAESTRCRLLNAGGSPQSTSRANPRDATGHGHRVEHPTPANQFVANQQRGASAMKVAPKKCAADVDLEGKLGVQ